MLTPAEIAIRDRARVAVVPTSDMGFRLAKAMYLDRAFAQREAAIVGKLRFDIAPGSCVALETIGGTVPFYGGPGAPKMYGCVRAVGFTIDATNATASTTLHIQALRSEREKELQGTTITEHPVFSDLWSGTYLAKPLNDRVAGSAGANSIKSSAPASALPLK